ncbi:MAG: SOS response-associated peptidase [Acidobacteriota bacterium]
MCGRFTIRSIDRLRARFNPRDWEEVLRQPLLRPRYNIAPGQEVLTVVEARNERSFELMNWGLIPSWSSEAAGFINARAETLEEKPSFSESFKRRRCLILADGFYEWRRNGKSKQPYYFQMKDESPFAFAGLWDQWLNPGRESESFKRNSAITSCSIITTAPNQLLAAIHDRMPVILPPEDYDTWLREDARPDELKALLAPYPADEMKSFPVSQQVNHAQVDNPQLVEPVEVKDIEQGLLF